MFQKRYIVEAKCGMSEEYRIIGEFDTFAEAELCRDVYFHEQTVYDLPADANIVDVRSLG